ncbi:MAG: inorganic phosphate transporter [Planctomycetes bacterium]|nr:inorganic phosphate transporter [Planctomycetota bacterium]
MTLATVLLILAVLTGLYMSWNIGANDVANAMGTSVGSGALTLKRAIIVAAIFEFAGAMLVGGTVTETVRKGIVDPERLGLVQEVAEVQSATAPPVGPPVDGDSGAVATADDPQAKRHPSPAAMQFALGMTCCLLAASLWLHLATYFGWPVSTTHSIVGSVVGFGVVCGGWEAVKWIKVAQIAGSWVVSPIMGALLAYLLFHGLRRLVLLADQPHLAIAKWGPMLMAPIFFVLCMALLFKGLKPLKLDFSLQSGALISLGVGLGALLISIPIFRHTTKGVGDLPLGEGLKRTEKVFLVLQVMTACFVAFAHGSNDVANAVGPLAGVVSAIQDGFSAKTPMPMWILLMGAVGIVIGLATYGYKVMGTVGEKITELTPSRGFTAEFAAATTIVTASKLGLPVSTTHTLVGAVIGVGIARGIGAINVQVLKGIVASWFITVPFTALLGAGSLALARLILL